MAQPRYPDLLGIGTQRSGTTWLWNNLTRHPGLYVPPFKEINYLSLRGTVPSAATRALRRNTLAALLREQARGELEDPREVDWFTRFALAERNDDAWYASLYHRVPLTQLAVDFSPAYCRMDDPQVMRAHTLCPNARVVLMMRDPIDRAWSQFCLETSMGRPPPVKQPADFQRWCQSHAVAPYHAYAAMLARWRRVFGQDNVFVGYYEELSTAPLGLLERLCTWLGTGFDPTWFAETAPQTFNRKAPKPIPAPLAAAAAPAMLPHLAPLATEPAAPPRAWLQRAMALAGLAPR